MSEKVVEIVSSSGEVIETTLKAASLSVFMKKMIENTGVEEKLISIPLTSFSTKVLRKIVEWMEHS